MFLRAGDLNRRVFLLSQRFVEMVLNPELFVSCPFLRGLSQLHAQQRSRVCG